MSARATFTFFHPHRVRWNECDMQGIVFNVNYFLYYDIGIWEWTRALGFPKDEMPEFLTVKAECEFLGSAIFDDEIDVGIRALRLGNKSVIMETAVFRGEECLNVGKIAYVYVEKGTRNTAPLPDDYIARVAGYEKTPPELARAAK